MERSTCLREVLAQFRPHAESLAEYQEKIGLPELTLAGVVSRSWLKERAIARGRLELTGELVNLDSMTVRRDFERRYARVLREHGVKYLDISELRSRFRPLTQLLARDLYEQGAAGLLYQSNLDNQTCVALFEGRALLKSTGRAIRLSEPAAELNAVLVDLGIVVSPG